jgi:hypothetical protein
VEFTDNAPKKEEMLVENFPRRPWGSGSAVEPTVSEFKSSMSGSTDLCLYRLHSAAEHLLFLFWCSDVQPELNNFAQSRLCSAPEHEPFQDKVGYKMAVQSWIAGGKLLG